MECGARTPSADVEETVDGLNVEQIREPMPTRAHTRRRTEVRTAQQQGSKHLQLIGSMDTGC